MTVVSDHAGIPSEGDLTGRSRGSGFTQEHLVLTRGVHPRTPDGAWVGATRGVTTTPTRNSWGRRTKSQGGVLDRGSCQPSHLSSK